MRRNRLSLTMSMTPLLNLHHWRTLEVLQKVLPMLTIQMALQIRLQERGYIWPTSDGSHIDLRELPGYQYDRNDALTWFRRKRALECENANGLPSGLAACA